MDDPTPHRWPRRWPLVLLAAPAGVATWSGWVGLGALTGFGPVHPLPGIADGWTINSAITLPIGVESYAAFALSSWLTPAPLSESTRMYSKWSALGALLLGMAGQVAYHLLTMAPPARDKAGHVLPPAAPWEITTLVSCLPVLVLGLGAGLAHMLHRDRAMQMDVKTSEASRRLAATDVPADSVPMEPEHVPAETVRPALDAPTLPAEPTAAPGAAPARLDIFELSGDDMDRLNLQRAPSEAARVRVALSALGLEATPTDVQTWLSERGHEIGRETVKSAIRRARAGATSTDQTDPGQVLTLAREPA